MPKERRVNGATGDEGDATQVVRGLQEKLQAVKGDAFRYGVVRVEDKVVVVFPGNIDYFGLSPEGARTLAQSLLDKAHDADGIVARVRRMGGPGTH